MNKNYLIYDIGKGVEAFSTKKGAELPFYVIQPHQIHGDRIAVVNNRNTQREDLEGIDALITNLPNCPIGVRSADCVPILLYDPIVSAIAAVHSGWRGTTQGIVNKVIRTMTMEFGSKPMDLRVIIGPSIGPESFCVHKDVVDAFETALFPMSQICKEYELETYFIDLWEANKWLLIQSGVEELNIYISGICSYKHHDEFYSARYEKNNKCGRTINVIKLLTNANNKNL